MPAPPPTLLRCLSAVAMLALLLVGSPAAAADRLRAADLLTPTPSSGGLIDNTAFVPTLGAAAAHAPFVGTIELSEVEMTTVPAAFKLRTVLGKDPKLFPHVALTFFTDGGDLVPVTQDVLRSGTMGTGRSFWDIIVQPGRVWSEQADGEWSRAAFPFALVNSIEGETHNGLATFLYKPGAVSGLRFQIVQQTAPFYVVDYFTATGTAPAAFAPARIEGLDRLTRIYRASLADNVPIASWADLVRKIGGGEKLAGFDSAMPAENVVLAGLDYDGIFYLEHCRSAAGPLPWCDRARFGVWSATKVLATATALLHLAQKYGPEVFDLRIADYVKPAADHASWRAVRFGDAINMATGLGVGSSKTDPNEIEDGYLDPAYSGWYEARSEAEKVTALLASDKAYPWGPGKVARYRDQDMFVLGVAMDNFLKSKEGPSADLWSMLEQEVYGPIGIHYAPTNRTIEPDGKPGQPLMAFGYYPTIGDMVKIARLYQDGGAKDGIQLLYAPRIRELAAGTAPRGLPTGQRNRFGETTYFTAFWEARYDSPEGCRLYIPRAVGWGGNIVALMPGKLTGIRLAKSWDDKSGATEDTIGMATVGNRLAKFCGP